ncbi:MAG TPA: SIS domain-containing protein, partial [Chloroflexota bacterium]
MGASDLIQRYFSELAFLSANLPTRLVAEVVEHLMAAHARGATVFVIGNGGSAATASHFANDLLKSGRGLDGQRLRTFALTDSVPILTAVGNDLGYERVFSEQLAANARAGDVLIALSGSGNSPNVLRGVELARQMGLTTIALGGFGGGRLAGMVDLAVVVPGSRIQVVEDAHSAI